VEVRASQGEVAFERSAELARMCGMESAGVGLGLSRHNVARCPTGVSYTEQNSAEQKQQ
jgi:hypothetical protein